MDESSEEVATSFIEAYGAFDVDQAIIVVDIATGAFTPVAEGRGRSGSTDHTLIVRI